MTVPIPYKGSESYIFVSYAHKDDQQVWQLIEHMQQDGFRVWFDQGIDPGTEWDEYIAQKVKDCGYLIALISENYLKSDNCKDELNYARKLNKNRLLVYLEEVTLPDGMDMRLNRLQAIYKTRFTDEHTFYQKLYSAHLIDSHRDSQKNVVTLNQSISHLGQQDSLNSFFDTTIAMSAEEIYKKGIQYYETDTDEGDEKAVQLFRIAAEQGNTEAMFRLGDCYECGIGVKQNDVMAAKYYHMAALLGHASALYRMGYLHEYGQGVEKNASLADEYYRSAAQLGDAKALNEFGFRYEFGIGAEKNNTLSVRFYRMAAERGDAIAQYTLGMLYANGKCVEKNDAIAVKYFRMAAKQGHEYAIEELRKRGVWMRGTR